MIPEHVMQELRYIEVRAARKTRMPRLGAYTSRLRGPGFDFDEHQPYRPGDDVRRIDWNVTARMNAPYVRHTHADRELNAIVAVDVSKSMDLRTSAHSKRETMMFITASLLFSAVADQINTGFVAFSDRVLLSKPPRRTRAAAWGILQQCWEHGSRGAGQTRIVPVVHHLAATLKRTTIIFIVSDFITSESPFDDHSLSMLAARHDVIAVIPEDPAERELPRGAGYVRLRDMESGRQTTVTLTRRSRALYAAEAKARRDALARQFYRVPMAHVFVPTDGNPVEPLLKYFATL
jgi:uncharacterized protein (DUF58 family)